MDKSNRLVILGNRLAVVSAGETSRQSQVSRIASSSSSSKARRRPRPLIQPSDPFDCDLGPDEGNDCRANRRIQSNLFYYYSVADRKCKIFFFRGCAGNRNRFRNRRQCEKTCASSSVSSSLNTTNLHYPVQKVSF